MSRKTPEWQGPPAGYFVLSSPNSGENGKLTCPRHEQCDGFFFTTAAECHEHEAEWHTGPYECPECSTSFASRSALARHIVSTGHQKWVCLRDGCDMHGVDFGCFVAYEAHVAQQHGDAGCSSAADLASTQGHATEGKARSATPKARSTASRSHSVTSETRSQAQRRPPRTPLANRPRAVFDTPLVNRTRAACETPLADKAASPRTPVPNKAPSAHDSPLANKTRPAYESPLAGKTRSAYAGRLAGEKRSAYETPSPARPRSAARTSSGSDILAAASSSTGLEEDEEEVDEGEDEGEDLYDSPVPADGSESTDQDGQLTDFICREKCCQKYLKNFATRHYYRLHTASFGHKAAATHGQKLEAEPLTPEQVEAKQQAMREFRCDAEECPQRGKTFSVSQTFYHHLGTKSHLQTHTPAEDTGVIASTETDDEPQVVCLLKGCNQYRHRFSSEATYYRHITRSLSHHNASNRKLPPQKQKRMSPRLMNKRRQKTGEGGQAVPVAYHQEAGLSHVPAVGGGAEVGRQFPGHFQGQDGQENVEFQAATAEAPMNAPPLTAGAPESDQVHPQQQALLSDYMPAPFHQHSPAPSAAAQNASSSEGQQDADAMEHLFQWLERTQ